MRRAMTIAALVGMGLGAGIVPDAEQADAAGVTRFFSTYLGGSGNDQIRALAVDADDNVYVAGWTNSIDFPVVGPQLPSGAPGLATDAFIAKLDASGALVWATRFGGYGYDEANALAVGTDGSIYVGGFTSSADFPVVNAYLASGSTGFVTKIDPSGALVYSTYYGPVGGAIVYAIAVDTSGGATFAGETDAFVSYNEYPDPFIARLDSSGMQLVYEKRFSTYYASDYASAVLVQSNGDALVAGRSSSAEFDIVDPYEEPPPFGTDYDGFLARVGPTGTVIRSAVYVGTRQEDFTSMAVDAAGAIYVAGRSYPDRFLETSLELIVVKFAPGEKAIEWVATPATSDLAVAVSLAPNGNVFVASEAGDVFELSSADGSTVARHPLHSGKPAALAVDSTGAICAAGTIESSRWLAPFHAARASPGGGRDGFIVRMPGIGALRPVSGFAATALDRSTIELSWIPDGDPVTAFEVERRGQAEPIAILDPSATTFRDEDLPPGSSREYRVVSVLASGVRVPSASDSDSTLTIVPSNVTVSPIGRGGHTLAWIPPQQRGDPEAYDVERRIGDGPWLALARVDSSPFVDRIPVPQGATLTYRVRAANDTEPLPFVESEQRVSHARFTLDVVRGRMHRGPTSARITAEGTFAAGGGAGVLLFHPTGSGAQLIAGPWTQPVIVEIAPALQGWKRKGNRLTWRSRGGSSRLALDFAAGTFRATVAGPLAPATETDITGFALVLGDSAAADVDVWQPSGRHGRDRILR